MVFRVVVFLSISLTVLSTYATSFVSSGVTDEIFINKASLIAEGVINKVFEIDSSENECYRQVYEFKVTEVLKGRYKVGDRLFVGLSNYTPDISKGTKQLIVLNNVTHKDELYKWCKIESTFLKLINHTDSSSIVSAYTIHDEKSIITYKCDEGSRNTRVLFDTKINYARTSYSIQGIQCHTASTDKVKFYTELKRIISK